MTKFNIYEFIEYTKINRNKFISYCEVLMDQYGNIILAVPSHTEAAIEYAIVKENKTRDQFKNEIPTMCLPLEWVVDKYGLIAIWYCGYMHSAYKNAPNRFQRKSLDMLIQHGLIIEEHVQEACEYKNYLWRKSMGYEQ